MNNYHRFISFPVDLLKEDPVNFLMGLIKKYDYPFEADKNLHYRFPLSDMPVEFSSWFNKTFDPVYLKDWEIFYTPPGGGLVIHSDGYLPFLNYTKFNFVYDGDNSLMKWYELKEGEVLDEAIPNTYSRMYTAIRPEQVDFKYESNIGVPSLVDVGSPHGIDNSANTKGR